VTTNNIPAFTSSLSKSSMGGHVMFVFVFGVLALSLSLCSTGHAADLPLFSWESGVEDWSAADVTLTADSILGVTDGLQSMRLSGLTKGYKNDIGYITFNGYSPDPFAAMNQAAAAIAAGVTDVTLEFDLAVDAAGVTEDNWAQIGMWVGSTGVGYLDYGTGDFLGGNASSTFPLVYNQALADGATIVNTGGNQYHVAVPLGPTLNIGEGSYFQIGFKSNGGWTGTMDLGIDKMVISSSYFPEYSEYTLFSWETPDDPGTPDINEQLEGWMDNPDPNHAGTQIISITSTGATDGSSALQLDRTPLVDGFAWGSGFYLDSDPDDTGADPVIQAEIDDYVTRVNAAAKVAIDITYQDQFPISPSWSQIYLAFSDETGVWYQEGSANFDINDADPNTTETLIFDIAEFYNNGDPEDLNLAIDGLMEGTTTFGIALGTSTDDGAIYQLDNFRLITEVVEDSADFDGDGDIDGNDFLTWQQGFGILADATHDQGDANLDGAVDGLDLDVWKSQFGTAAAQTAIAAVPEPSTVMLTLVVALVGMVRGRGNLVGGKRLS
jgi:hypothetical protein